MPTCRFGRDAVHFIAEGKKKTWFKQSERPGKSYTRGSIFEENDEILGRKVLWKDHCGWSLIA